MTRPTWLPAWIHKPHLNPSSEAMRRRLVSFAVVCLLIAGGVAFALIYTRAQVNCLQDQLKARNRPTAEQAVADQKLATANVTYFLANVTYVQSQAVDAAALTAVVTAVSAPKSQQLKLFKAFIAAQQAYTTATTAEATAAQAIADAEVAWKNTVIKVQTERAAHPLGNC